MRSGLLGASALFLATQLACSSEEDALFGSTGGPGCTAGQQVGCACPGGEQGIQVCKADGTGFGECGCGAGGAGGSGGHATGGVGGAGECTAGATVPCYSGPAGTQGIGLCVAGAQTCKPDESGFGPCEGEVLPQSETCSTPGDDDCDGQTNEDGTDCGCTPGSQADCYSFPPATEDVGPCHGGTQLCNATGTGYGPCVGEVGPQPETCTTSIDDDCDGQVNEDGAGCVCPPNGTAPCYDGPAGTENVGSCKGGTKTCNDQGTAWGLCVGQVLPGPDACATAADEDCSGAPTPCVDVVAWTKSFGSPSAQCQVDQVATDAAGNVFGLIGQAVSCDFGAGPEWGAIVVKLDPNGNLLWHKSFAVNGRGLAIDAGGSVVFAGDYGASPDLGGGPLPAPSSNFALFVAKLDGSGAHVWSKGFVPGSNGAYGYALAVDPSGNVIFGGNFGGCITFGGGTLCSAQSSELFVAKFSPTGAHLWSKIGDTAGGAVDALATDAAGNIAAVGFFYQSISFGGPPQGGAGPEFVAKLDSNGAPVFVKPCGGGSQGYWMRTMFDVAGNVLVAGYYFQGTVDLGGGPIGSGTGGFVGKLDPNGGHLFSKDNGASEYITGLAVDPSGNAHLTGGFQGLVAMAGTVLQSASGSVDVFVAKYDSSGAGVSAKGYGGAQEEAGWDIAIDPVGARIVGGWFQGTLDFGSGPIAAVGTKDGFIAKLPP